MPPIPSRCQPIQDEIDALLAERVDLQAELHEAAPGQKAGIVGQIRAVTALIDEKRRELAACVAAPVGPSTVLVVNMIPNNQSNETSQNSEPNLAVNHFNPLQIAGSCFIPSADTTAPTFVSTDGGLTWSRNLNVPSQSGSVSGTGDITLRFGGPANLYAGILRLPGFLRLNILRTGNFLGAALMTVLVDRTGSGVDQPYVQGARVLGGAGVGNERVYVGNNDFNAAGGQTATIDQSLNAAAAPPAPPPPASGFNAMRIETRATGGQDGPPIRPAIHPDGTVYAIFYGWRTMTGNFNPFGSATTDVVVVRDDNWGAGATPFTALTDPAAPAGDGAVGRRVVTNRTVPWANTSQRPAPQQPFGQERFVGSNLTIAVDPRNSSTVYIAWADRVGTTDYTLHVRRSIDRGVTWSGDLRTITNATNPALAINIRGRVGFLYQQLTGAGGPLANQRWVTHLERTENDFATIDDLVLATVPANAPAPAFIPYIGDYVHVMTVGKDFYGIFSANNTPNNANFPNGVIYQRNANFATQTLLGTDGVTAVAVSVDPFFVNVAEMPAATDFYVRDWTDTPASADIGLEPSTNPWFFTNPDVWNRRSNAPGGFNANDQPISEDPKQGPGAAGHNWAFARIRRNASGTAETVTAHFLVSEFGTGSNYQDAGPTPDPTLAFGAADLVQAMSSGYRWQLPATTSSHVCLAVEISTPTDPLAPPSLLGRAPGWPTTDLIVLNDNNKAQRNMGVYAAAGIGRITLYALLHNAALFTRDMAIRFEPGAAVRKRLGGAVLGEVGGRQKAVKGPGALSFRRMQPGENRWLALTFELPEDVELEKEEEPLAVTFLEMVGNVPVNGFGLGIGLASAEDALRGILELHTADFMRMAAGFDVEGAAEESEAAAALLPEPGEGTYVEFLRSRLESVQKVCADLLAREGGGNDPFEISVALADLVAALESGDVRRVLPRHMTFAHKLDAFLTMLVKARGDAADILQTVEWLAELYEQLPHLRVRGLWRGVSLRARHYALAYEAREVGNDDYPALVEGLLPSFRETARLLESVGVRLEPEIAAMERALDSPAALQKAQREYLLKLQGVADAGKR